MIDRVHGVAQRTMRRSLFSFGYRGRQPCCLFSVGQDRLVIVVRPAYGVISACSISHSSHWPASPSMEISMCTLCIDSSSGLPSSSLCLPLNTACFVKLAGPCCTRLIQSSSLICTALFLHHVSFAHNCSLSSPFSLACA